MEPIMRLNKIVFISIFSLLFSTTALAEFRVDHRTFSGNGDPKVEELVKKCQAIEDQRYNTTIEYYRYYDKIVEGKTKYKNVNDSPELEALDNKADSFTKQLRALHCI